MPEVRARARGRRLRRRAHRRRRRVGARLQGHLAPAGQARHDGRGPPHFSNLPYYLDADVKLAQSNAVLRYLGRKHGLYGAAGAEHVVDVVLDQATDLDNAITGPCYRDFAALKPFFLDVLPEKLDAWAARLGGGPYVTGASLSIGDLKIYETLRKLALIEKAQGTAVLARYASLAAFVARVDVDLGTYRASPAFLERPLNNPHAQFR